jgi:hypothetical protein
MKNQSSQRPKWASKLHNLKNKAIVFTNSKENPIPTVRTVFVFCWELWEPLLIEFIERNFVPKKEKIVPKKGSKIEMVEKKFGVDLGYKTDEDLYKQLKKEGLPSLAKLLKMTKQP